MSRSNVFQHVTIVDRSAFSVVRRKVRCSFSLAAPLYGQLLLLWLFSRVCATKPSIQCPLCSRPLDICQRQPKEMLDFSFSIGDSVHMCTSDIAVSCPSLTERSENYARLDACLHAEGRSKYLMDGSSHIEETIQNPSFLCFG